MFNTEAREGSSEGGVSGDTHHTLQGDEGDEERCHCPRRTQRTGFARPLAGWTRLFREGFRSPYFNPFYAIWEMTFMSLSVSGENTEDGVFCEEGEDELFYFVDILIFLLCSCHQSANFVSEFVFTPEEISFIYYLP